MTTSGRAVRIAHVTSVLGHAGAGVSSVVEALSGQQLQAGLQVGVFGLRAAGGPVDFQSDWAGAPAEAFSTAGPSALGFAPGLARALERFLPDLIHLHGLWTLPSVAALGVSRRLGIPRVVSPHGMLDDWAMKQSRRKKRIALALFERANLAGSTVHALSMSEAKSVRAFGIGSPVATIPNGVDPPPQGWSRRLESPWAGKLSSTAKVMLFLSRIHPKKGLPALIAAMNETRGLIDIHDWHLVIAGWNQEGHQHELSQLIADFGLGGRIHFVGPVFGAAKLSALAHADLFVLPSLSEGLPVSVLEAWAHGLPVLMTPHCNLPEGVRAGAAWESEPEPLALAACLRQVLSMGAAEMASMGQAGERLVTEKFSWKSVQQQFTHLYLWLLRQGRDDLPPAFVSCVQSNGRL